MYETSFWTVKFKNEYLHLQKNWIFQWENNVVHFKILDYLNGLLWKKKNATLFIIQARVILTF